MVKPFDFGEIRLEAGGSGSVPGVPEPETPFRIALLGDFSGRGSRGLCETGAALARRRAVPIDRDNFEEVLGKFGVELQLPIGRDGSSLPFRFAELDDFHPDRLFEQSEMFRRLRELRLRLQDPATFAAAAEELGIRAGGTAPEEPKPAPPVRPPAFPDGEQAAAGSLLDQMLAQTEARGPAKGPSRAPDEMQEFLRRVTEPHLVQATDPRQAEVLAMIDRAIGSPLRALLHVPDFQALEAAWRAVFLLVRRMETDSQLKLYLLDVTKEELAADLGPASDLRATGTYRLLVEKTVETPGAEPWALLAGNYTLGPGREDAELLGRLAKIASAAGAPFVAAASPWLVGCESFGEQPDPAEWRAEQKPEDAAAWAALRGLAEASSVGLALPRFVLRLPYGKKTDSIETFEFEEMTGAPSHEDYLWGNPAFACALLLAESFSDAGWELRPGMHAQIDGLPLHVFERGGEAEAKPCAEALLTETAAERILERGVMALVSLKEQDAVRLLRFQSIAEPLRALAGRWNG
jgi:type VI secretion system protein ImpC